MCGSTSRLPRPLPPAPVTAPRRARVRVEDSMKRTPHDPDCQCPDCQRGPEGQPKPASRFAAEREQIAQLVAGLRARNNHRDRRPNYAVAFALQQLETAELWLARADGAV